MGHVFQFAWEIKLIQFFQAYIIKYPILAGVAELFTMFGEPAFSVLIIGFFYWGINKEYGKRLTFNIMGATLLTCYFKNIFQRRRPYFDNDVVCLRPADPDYGVMDIEGQGFSFPSGHSTNIGVIATGVSRYFKRNFITIIFSLLCIFVAVSRFALGVHYPTNVLSGLTVGISYVYLSDYLVNKLGRDRFYFLVIVLFSSGFLFCKSLDYYTVYGILVGFVISELYEEKNVNFESTDKPVKLLMRILCGGLLFLAVAEIPKLFISAEILTSASLVSYLIRSVRYMFATIAAFGIYPKLFKYSLFK